MNVLVDDRLHCVITDFGQSKLRSEVYRLTGGGEKGKTSDIVSFGVFLSGITIVSWNDEVEGPGNSGRQEHDIGRGRRLRICHHVY